MTHATQTNIYTVWLGGIPDVEGVTLDQATEVAKQWLDDGYDDVIVELDQ